MPGEALLLDSDYPNLVLGPGLRREISDEVLVTRAGVLRKKDPGPIYWVDCHSKRYVAARGENVDCQSWGHIQSGHRYVSLPVD